MKRVMIGAIVALSLFSGCTGEARVENGSTAEQPTPTAVVEGTTPDTADAPGGPDVERQPVPYVPAGQPGSAQDYADMIERLEEQIPAEFHTQVPWPDLRNPNPIVAQVEIFELWIWMTANLPEPVLVEVMAAPRSPSREEIAAVFGGIDVRNELEIRTGNGYEAFDHVVVTFESAGLPLWLGRDVPEDAVVVYYSDNSGPVNVIDRDTREFISQSPATPTRTWLSIMVPTNVGWQLWRDQLLDASNGLEVPDVPPPAGPQQRRTNARGLVMRSHFVTTPFALAVCLVLVLSACRSSTAVDDSTTTSEDPTSAPSTGTENDFKDPSAGPDRDPNEPRIVPPLELPATAPGSDAAARALLEDLDRFITDDQRAAGVPWPDLRNPDPIASYQSDAAFQNWMAANNPTPSLVEAYTAPGSPERGFDLEMFDERNRFDLRSGPGNPPYSMRVEDLVHPAATGITDALLAQVPEGSAAVVYWDSMGPSDTFTSDGQFWGRFDGWTNVGPWVAIMAPTDVGWQVWWDELTDPPPPGSREQKGLPTEETPRVEV